MLQYLSQYCLMNVKTLHSFYKYYNNKQGKCNQTQYKNCYNNRKIYEFSVSYDKIFKYPKTNQWLFHIYHLILVNPSVRLKFCAFNVTEILTNNMGF